LLHRRLGAAQERTAEKEGNPTDVSEFPRHVLLPTESISWRCRTTQFYPITYLSVEIRAILEENEARIKTST
jgi:hypothetical protein